MTTNFPSSIDAFTNPTSADTLDNPPHDQQHADINDAMEAVQTSLLDGAPLHIDDDNERVGIGTTTPSQTLDVRSANDNTSVFQHTTNGSDARIELRAPEAGGTSRAGQVFFDPDANFVGFRNGNINAMGVDSSGNVGIGTTSPDAILHVNGAGGVNVPMYVTSTDSVAGIAFSDSDSTTNTQVIVAAVGDDMRLTAGGSARMLIDSSGNVGINDTTPSYTLDVNGDINTTGDLRIGGTAVGIWQDWTPSYLNFSATTSRAKYVQVNDLVFIDLQAQLTSTVTATMFIDGLPVNGSVNTDLYAIARDASSSVTYQSYQVQTSGQTALRFWGSVGGTGVSNWSVSYPTTWASGDYIYIKGYYRAI